MWNKKSYPRSSKSKLVKANVFFSLCYQGDTTDSLDFTGSHWISQQPELLYWSEWAPKAPCPSNMSTVRDENKSTNTGALE